MAHATTREVVDDLLDRIATGKPAHIADLYAPEVDWALDWPDGPVSDAVPWIRPRPDRAAVEKHYRALAAGNGPGAEPTSTDAVLVTGEHAVVLGTLHNVVKATGAEYAARFALHLTVRSGLIVRHHVYEDSLAVALAAGSVVPA